MLKACNECENQVSDKATACPRCGAPIQAQVIEATGRRYKATQLLGGLMLVMSCPAVMAETSGGVGGAGTVGILLFLIGGLVYLGGSIGAWWKHG